MALKLSLFLKRFNWYITRLVVKNADHKDVPYDDIDFSAQIVDDILDLMWNTIEN
jgi:hypothetical protein